jgi:hypothetical protein
VDVPVAGRYRPLARPCPSPRAGNLATDDNQLTGGPELDATPPEGSVMTEPSTPRPVPGPPRPGPGPEDPAGAPAAPPTSAADPFADLAQRPIAEQVAVFETEHARLERELGTIDQL